MKTVIPISNRGTVTLPPKMRQKLGFGAGENPLVIVEERDGELVLRPASAVAVRDIPKETIKKWITDDEAGMTEFDSFEPAG